MTVNPRSPQTPSLVEKDTDPKVEKTYGLAYFFLKHWKWSATALVLIFGTASVFAVSSLFLMPKRIDCVKMFWPLASASTRLYCAESKAEKKNLQGLLDAIDLVKDLPDDHPLRNEINDRLAEWSQNILNLAEEKVQQGKLEEGIAIAKSVPDYLAAYKLVDERVKKWQSIWSEAATILQEVEAQLRLSTWSKAIEASVKLTALKNNYWSNVRYIEIVKKIELAREDSGKLDVAYKLMRRGGIDNLLKAIEGARQISTDSYAYKEAKDILDESKNKILTYINELTDKKQWQKALDLSDRIPEGVGIKEELQDWIQLANAGSTADLSTIGSLEIAISQAKEIKANSPVYDRAQKLIAVWEEEIVAVGILSDARQLAQVGTVPQFQAAIAKANLIAANSPKYQEARQEIANWQEQIETIEDRPLLENAKQIALDNNPQAWQSAIDRANQISSDRALYKEAQKEVEVWRGEIQRIEDRPLLDQAIALANASNYTAAIEIAQKITKDRALYAESQEQIRNWRGELSARANLENANSLATQQTSSSLLQAITIARKIPNTSELYGQSIDSINRWSSEILGIAQERSTTDIQGAIDIANTIPSGTDAYSTARSQIEIWKKLLPDTNNTRNDSSAPLFGSGQSSGN
jgi:hypothetical protein